MAEFENILSARGIYNS